ncbi:hypothetical protein [Azospirillum doebereinerae]
MTSRGELRGALIEGLIVSSGGYGARPRVWPPSPRRRKPS